MLMRVTRLKLYEKFKNHGDRVMTSDYCLLRF